MQQGQTQARSAGVGSQKHKAVRLAGVTAGLVYSLSLLLVFSGSVTQAFAQASIKPQSMTVLKDVDARFVSYNIEAVEVTGGRFWAPFTSLPKSAPQPGSRPDGGSSDTRFQYRPPINLANPKLRKLAAALGPAYVRVSGTWRNSTFFQDNDEPALKEPPAGFQNVMTRAQWKGVIEFARAVNGEIVSSVSTSAGTRDQNGVWTTTQAKAWFDYTKSIGGRIAAMEYMNEPTLMGLSGADTKYGAAEYARDSRIFEGFLKAESPGTIYLGPSSAAEGLNPPSSSRPMRLIPSADLMTATGPAFDGFSYHVYYTRSQRCTPSGGPDPNLLLSAEWFDRGLRVWGFYSKLRDQFLPGKPLWLTETGEASCGGDTWASQFIDSFRLLDQFGSLAQKGVRSVMHNTLAASDYGMLNEETYDPRPNYWAALLWKRTMGNRSLDPGAAGSDKLRVYAQCTAGSKRGVTVLVMNVDQAAPHPVSIASPALRYTLSTPDLLSTTVLLNGKELKVAADGTVPVFKGESVSAGVVNLPPATITFFTFSSARNSGCGQ